MDIEEFTKSYEIALGTQDWKIIEPLISTIATVIFSDGSVHIGRDNIQKAFEKNFSIIKNEKYLIENVKWLIKEGLYGVYLFEFRWTGIVKGNSVSGSGYGTSVIRKEEGKWKLLTEHLGSNSNSPQ